MEQINNNNNNNFYNDYDKNSSRTKNLWHGRPNIGKQNIVFFGFNL